MTTLLIVEDDPALRAALGLTLEAAGYRVVVAEDGERGVELASTTRPDLILMDIMLPRINGWQAKQRLAADPEVAGIPVIGVSALGDGESLARAQELGFAGYLVKPIRLSDLTQAIETTLRGATP